MLSCENNALFVMPNSLIGGAERVAFNLIAYLLSSDWSVTLITMSRGRSSGWDQLERYEKFNWIAIPSKSEKSGIVPFILAVLKESNLKKFKITYSTHVHMNAMVSCLRKFRILKTDKLICRESTVIFMRETVRPHVYYKFLYKLYKSVDILVCQTDIMRSNLLKSAPFIKNLNINVIENPVNIDYIEEKIEKNDYSNHEDSYDILFCGRLIPLKRADLLIRSLSKIEDKKWKSAHFLGRGDIKELEELSEELGIRNKIIFHGNVGNPYSFFSRARVGVLTSSIEGFPNVLLEMMASGTDRIVSSLCTPSVVDLEGVDIIDPIDEERLANALEQALSGESRSDLYRDYIDRKRSVKSFWERIQTGLSPSQKI